MDLWDIDFIKSIALKNKNRRKFKYKFKNNNRKVKNNKIKSKINQNTSYQNMMAKNPFKTMLKKNDEELDQALKNEFDQNQSKPHFGTREV